MHNLTYIDKVFQLRNAFHNISGHYKNVFSYLTGYFQIINWWKGKPSGSIACTRKQQPRFYWSCKQFHYFHKWLEQISNGQYLTVQLNTFLKIAFSNVSLCKWVNSVWNRSILRALQAAGIWNIRDCLSSYNPVFRWNKIEISLQFIINEDILMT